MTRTKNDSRCGLVFPTALGWMAIAWCDSQVTAVTFGHRSASAARTNLAENVSCAEDCPVLHDGQPRPEGIRDHQWELVERLIAFAAGEPDTFLDVDIALDHLSDFQRDVVTFCRHIRYGRTVTYAELARRAGSPRAARAVGNVMRTNRYPLLVPCHRVVGTAGLGGYSAPDGLAMKERLLRMEAENAFLSLES